MTFVWSPGFLCVNAIETLQVTDLQTTAVEQIIKRIRSARGDKLPQQGDVPNNSDLLVEQESFSQKA